MAPSVLLLDDDEDVRSALSELVRRVVQCDVISLSSVSELRRSGSDALQTQIAFLDVNLGVNLPDGLDAYAWIKRRGYQGQIFFLTGHGCSHPAVMKAYKLGEANVLSKPVPWKNLIDLVRESIGNGENKAQST